MPAHPGSGRRQSGGPINTRGCRAVRRTSTLSRSMAHDPGSWVRRGGAGPWWLELGVGFTPSAPSTTRELFDVEGPFTREHVVDGAAQLVCQDADGLGLAVLAPESFHEL